MEVKSPEKSSQFDLKIELTQNLCLNDPNDPKTATASHGS
jgi:hypothetical protein